MRTLHVAALPFPTQQGTQAAIHAMLSALHAAGQEPSLLCYAHGSAGAALPYRIYRLDRSLGVRSLRSGPSLGKSLLDILLARELRKLVRRERFDWIVAHHVEGALACVLAGVTRFAFIAHTDLAQELKFYAPSRWAPACVRAGSSLDRFLVRRAACALAVSPLLAAQLSAASDVCVRALRLPWPLPAPPVRDERRSARAQLGLHESEEVLLYAGNVDAYQGLGPLVQGISQLVRMRPTVRWLFATQEPRRVAERIDLPVGTRVTSLANEAERRLVHAAADLAVVPRAAAGGLPIKLLDALARGVPVVTTRRAAAGLALADVCRFADGEGVHGFAHAIAQMLDDRSPDWVHRGRAYIEREHSSAAFMRDFQAALASAGN